MGLFFSRNKKEFQYKRVNARLAKSLGAPDSGNKHDHQKSSAQNGPTRPNEWQKWRINFVIGFFCLIWTALWGRAWYLQMVEGPRLADKARRQHMASELVSGKRGQIYDRNGQVLAHSVEARSIYANPQEVDDPTRTAQILAPILDVDKQKLISDLGDTRRKFVWLKRKVDDNTALAVREASLAGIGFTKEYDRFYPFKHMAGQLLGFVGMDDKGLEGLERAMEPVLGVMPVRQIVQRDAMGRKFYLNESGESEPIGKDIILSLDMTVQFIAEEAIARVVKEFDARWGGALVVDVKNGDILAWAQYPFFNPNSYRDYEASIYRNRLANDALEPGSTFKPFIMAAAIQSKKINVNTLIDCEGGKWVNKNFTIRDTSTRGILPANKVLRYSSNIGMAKIGQMLGANEMHKNLSALGFGQSLNLPISNSKGILRRPRDWSEVDIMATSFGQSISVTILQMAQAYLSMLNHGMYKPLKLVLDNDYVQEAPRRVYTEQSVKAVLEMMREVVQEKDGTGKQARIDGVEVGGKTGTAQKADQRSKTYGEKRLASFVGFLPAADPRYLILVFVDEPTRNQFGGIVAAPAFKEIANKVLTHSGILNDSALVMKKNDVKSGARGLKLASAPSQPAFRTVSAHSPVQADNLRFPGHLAQPSSQIPDVTGKSVRNAVELFARAGIVPELKGSGTRVVRQVPPPGIPWPEQDKKTAYILWLSER